MAANNSKKFYCGVDYAFQRIGGKYKARVMWHLQEKSLRYSELKRKIDGITPKMLTQTLRELEEDQLLTRLAFPEVPPRVEYSLTDTARELIPFIEQMRIWAERQMPG